MNERSYEKNSPQQVIDGFSFSTANFQKSKLITFFYTMDSTQREIKKLIHKQFTKQEVKKIIEKLCANLKSNPLIYKQLHLII